VSIERRACKRTARPCGIALALALAMAMAMAAGHPRAAGAATITVTDNTDGAATNGNCTLREAVIAANTDAPRDACPAGSGADVIVLAAATYSLTVAGASEDASLTGDLDITSDITVVGTGAGATIVRSAVADRVFHVLSTGNCVIVGRGSQHFFRHRTDTLRVFLYAPRKEKIQRLLKTGVNASQVEHLVDTVDVDRAAFVEKYFHIQWPNRAIYHAMLNTAVGDEMVIGEVLGLKTSLEQTANRTKAASAADSP